MNHSFARAAGALLLAALAAGAGYWWGTRAMPALQAASATAPDAGTAPARKLRYYRNPMGLPDTSPVPKKDAMGMDYIPVYEGEDEGPPALPGSVQLSPQKLQALGVRTEPVALRSLGRVLRAAGRIEMDERRSVAVAPRFEGYVEKVFVAATGQPVAKGTPLLEAYAPELLAAQREYAIASRGVQALGQAAAEAQQGMQQLAEASLARLRNWDMDPTQLRALSETGAVQRTLTLRAPVAGYVLEKKAVQGMRFMPGEVLYQISDLSSVWVLADVAEQDIALLRTGARARVSVGAFAGQNFEARLDYIYPTLNTATRSVTVRLELPNRGGLLRPGMYAQVELDAGAQAPVLSVPVSAVIDSGTRQVALVQTAPGRFEPRELRLGARSEQHVQVLQGLHEGEPVVVAANFLIDAESNLSAALAGLAAPQATASVGHQASGQVQEVDAAAGTVTLSHGPVASLKWPAMTMEFSVANAALLKDLRPQARVDFEFVERGKGEWVITRVQPQGRPAP